MVLSTDIVLRNTKLGALPGCAPAALTLGRVKGLAQASEGKLSDTEMLLMADMYSRAREELRLAFEAMPEAEQRSGRAVARRLRAADEARKKLAQEEDAAEAKERDSEVREARRALARLGI